jgi:hypothetical protein
MSCQIKYSLMSSTKATMEVVGEKRYENLRFLKTFCDFLWFSDFCSFSRWTWLRTVPLKVVVTKSGFHMKYDLISNVKAQKKFRLRSVMQDEYFWINLKTGHFWGSGGGVWKKSIVWKKIFCQKSKQKL